MENKSIDIKNIANTLAMISQAMEKVVPFAGSENIGTFLNCTIAIKNLTNEVISSINEQNEKTTES